MEKEEKRTGQVKKMMTSTPRTPPTWPNTELSKVNSPTSLVFMKTTPLNGVCERLIRTKYVLYMYFSFLLNPNPALWLLREQQTQPSQVGQWAKKPSKKEETKGRETNHKGQSTHTQGNENTIACRQKQKVRECGSTIACRQNVRVVCGYCSSYNLLNSSHESNVSNVRYGCV